ncbi:MAG: cytosine permease [Pseudomonadota bacterium]
METEDEFAVVAIGSEQRVAWPRIAAVSAMVAFSLPTFITGLEISEGLSPTSALGALLLGSVIIFVVGAAMGVIGALTHMSSYLLVRIAFGDRGAGVVNLAFAISLLGWFGVNINLFAEAASGLAMSVFGGSLPSLVWIALASAGMTITTLIGFSAINRLSVLLVPVLAIVTGLLIFQSAEIFSIAEFFAQDSGETLSFGDGVSAVVGAIIIGAIILPDITRFARHWSGAVYTAFFSYIVVQLIVMGAAAYAGAATNQHDVIDLMVDIGLGVGAFVIVIAGSWVLNSLNLYSALLGIKATFPNLPTQALTLFLGGVGVIAGALNLLENFITFLFYLSVIFIPVAGVLLADFFVIRRDSYKIDTLTENRAFNPKAFLSWVIGAVIAILMSNSILPSITGMAAVDAAAMSGFLYTFFAWSERERRVVKGTVQ